MTDSPGLIVSGGGSIAISTDAMLADAVKLRSLALALPTVSLGLRHAETMTGQAEAVALGSWRVREAGAAIGLASRQLDAAAEHCAGIGQALDAAATTAGRAEQEATARFIAIAEELAARAGSLVGDAVERNPVLARLLTVLALSTLRRMLGDSIAPGDAELPTGLNEFLSDPRVVHLLRALVMTVDDFAGGIVQIPASLRDSTSEVGIAAVMLLTLGSLAGLFSGAPVTTSTAGRSWPTRPAQSVAETAERIPNPVIGDEAQVRIDKYSAPGMPDRFEIFIGGTVNFSPVATGEPFDTTSNLELMADLPAGSFDGVKQSMAMAGIGRDSHIVVTGHSQGALIAAKIAESGDYSVDAVMLFGSPSGQVPVPASIPTLIVEHLEDPVVSLGGLQSNRDATIVQAMALRGPDPVPTGIALPAHHIEAYIETAEAIDQRAESADIVAFRQRLAALTEGYGDGRAQRYLVERASP